MVVDSGNFDWAKSGRFPAFTEPNEAYHGLQFTEHFGRKAFAAKMRLEVMRDIGLTMNPFAGWLLIQGSVNFSYQLPILIAFLQVLKRSVFVHKGIRTMHWLWQRTLLNLYACVLILTTSTLQFP